MGRARILIADDELAMINLLRSTLEAGGFQTLVAMDGEEAIRITEKEVPDLMILDIMMPRMDGFEVCRRVREWSAMPILMLSARSDAEDKVKCLDLGADDYIAKPFDVTELIARLKALFRRAQKTLNKSTHPAMTCDDIQIDFATRRVTVVGREAKLTPTEYNLLQELALNAGKVLTHSQLLKAVWGTEYRDEKQYLHVFIGHLRHKLKPADKHIVTVPGIGYGFIVLRVEVRVGEGEIVKIKQAGLLGRFVLKEDSEPSL